MADSPWLGSSGRGVTQTAEPSAAELSEHFTKTFGGMVDYATQNGLALVRSHADVDAAIGGKPSVLMASESAEFLGGDIAGLSKAFDMGLRQMQLVHYIKNPVADAFTASPPAVHNGLSPLGKELVAACESQGILLDLAHLSTAGLDQALALATKPLVWSHGWVHADGGSPRDSSDYLQRRLSLAHVKAIVARGGVVGLWGLGTATGTSA